MLAVTLAFWGIGAMVHANAAYDTVLSCDRGADVCTVTKLHDFFAYERDRFRPSDYQSLRLEDPTGGRHGDGCLILTLSRAQAVSICEPGATHPDFATAVQRYFTDLERMSLQASIPRKASGYLAIAFFGALSLPFLAGFVMGVWERLRPKKPALPTGREGIGSRR